ncbi:MAG: NAD(P)/FAD-dependent oxidoreductase [Minwuiales bacterium]|nr:NAD(P)/FAD-dependent oxidoreductase [Minwuiales bacterium]
MTSAIVIGAGASGLATAHALQAAGVNVRVLERESYVATPWRQRHPQLRLNTHRLLSSLPGMKMPSRFGAFAARDDMVRYLEDYAAAVAAPIAFDTPVSRIDRTEAGWRVETPGNSLRVDHVVVATGVDRVPVTPDWPGMDGFGGEILHAAHFGDVARYRGRRVLVVGAGNSGTDLLNHLARVDIGKVWVSVRHGPAMVPTRFLGCPTQLISPMLDALPPAAADRVLDLTEWLAFGSLRKHGLPRHWQGGATRFAETGTAPAIDNGFVAALKAGRVTVVPEIDRFEPDGIRLTDGQRIEPDIVVAATGYRTGLAPMLGHLGVLDEREWPVVHGDQQDTRWPGLWFNGMRPPLSGTLGAVGKTGQRIAAAIVASSEPGPHKASE